MVHFLEGIAPIRFWYISPNENSNKYKSSLLSWLIKALTECFFQGNVPLRHPLNAKLPFLSLLRSAFNEVNDWAPGEHYANALAEDPLFSLQIIMSWNFVLSCYKELEPCKYFVQHEDWRVYDWH